MFMFLQYLQVGMTVGFMTTVNANSMGSDLLCEGFRSTLGMSMYYLFYHSGNVSGAVSSNVYRSNDSLGL
jgi:hypothetical protein